MQVLIKNQKKMQGKQKQSNMKKYLFHLIVQAFQQKSAQIQALELFSQNCDFSSFIQKITKNYKLHQIKIFQPYYYKDQKKKQQIEYIASSESLMLQILSLVQAIFYCFIFVSAIVFTNIYIEHSKLSHTNFTKDQAPKIKILVLCLLTLFLLFLTYFNHCHGQKGILECIYIDPNSQSLARNIAIAIFINTTLFLGGLHQQLYNGQIKRKFLRFYKKQFQWDLFKKLFIVPLCVEIVYRALICRVIDPNLNHPSFFVFFSGILFGISHLVNFFKFGQKFDLEFSLKSAMIQVVYNTLFGLYTSHIFTKSHDLISSVVIQVYANFMGFPEYFQILKGNTYDDRIKKSTLFYLFGVAGCLSCCLLL